MNKTTVEQMSAIGQKVSFLLIEDSLDVDMH